MCWAREANMSAISVNGESPAVAECSSTSRIFSPVRVPPGSRVTVTEMPVGAQRTRQFLDLRALAAAVETFESDKFSARGHVGNDSRRAGSERLWTATRRQTICRLIYSDGDTSVRLCLHRRGANRKSGGEMGIGSHSGVRYFLCLAIVLLSSFSLLGANAPTVALTVDASEAPRKIFHAELHIPAKPGTLTLYYPKWIPGEHGPTGPITDLTGLKFTASGKTLPWRRDLLDGFTFHVEVP